MTGDGSEFEERVYNILETTWARMEAEHNSGVRGSPANEKVLEAFEARPINDPSAWYKEQYAKSGVVWPGPEHPTEIDADIQARIQQIAKAYKASQASIQAPLQRRPRDDSRAR